MTWLRNRCLPMAYLALLATLVVVGCTSKEDPSETLTVCGNHSCGELVMVTTDTSSDGYHYLSPRLSPDGTTIAFTCDWWSLPSDPRYAGDDYFVNYRQVGLIPVQTGVEPAANLAALGARLVRLQDFNLLISGTGDFQQGAADFDKGPAGVGGRSVTPVPDAGAHRFPHVPCRHHEPRSDHGDARVHGARRCHAVAGPVAAPGTDAVARRPLAGLHALGLCDSRFVRDVLRPVAVGARHVDGRRQRRLRRARFPGDDGVFAHRDPGMVAGRFHARLQWRPRRGGTAWGGHGVVHGRLRHHGPGCRHHGAGPQPASADVNAAGRGRPDHGRAEHVAVLLARRTAASTSSRRAVRRPSRCTTATSGACRPTERLDPEIYFFTRADEADPTHQPRRFDAVEQRARLPDRDA